MRIDSKATIAGVNAKVLRDWFRKNAHVGFDSADVAALGTNVGALTAEGLIELDPDSRYCPPGKKDDWYGLTEAGRRLLNASAAPSFTRAVAEQKMAELLERVKEVNSNKKFLARVTRVRVFGSFLTDAPMLNDIDLVVETEDKTELAPGEREWTELVLGHEDNNNGNFLTRLFFPTNQALRYLKSGSRHYSFHPVTDSVLKRPDVQMTTLFELK